MNVPPPPPPMHAFLLTLETNYANVPISMNTRECQGIHERVTATFPDKLDGEPNNVFAFVANFGERVTAAGWGLMATSMLTLTVIMTGMIRTINLVSDHGTITMSQL